MATVRSQKAGIKPAENAISWEDIEAALQTVTGLRARGRMQEADAVYALVKAELARREGPISEDALTPELVEALEASDAEIAAGKIVPHEVVAQGRAAVEEYVRRREAGNVDSRSAAAVAAYRQDWQTRRRAAGRRA
ncbi:MAG: hypothetical protein HY332_11715 [Chloroflexi bacterium]|nr:hypothetical protein [Chloroflexota bacterium]